MASDIASLESTDTKRGTEDLEIMKRQGRKPQALGRGSLQT